MARNIFLSFHQADELEVNIWRRRFGGYFNEIRSLGLSEYGDDFADHIESGDSDYVMRKIREDKIAGTSCTVVLIGKCTWARRYVDWEIAATLRNFNDSQRGGLIAVQLPGAQDNGWSKLPPRLDLNVERDNGVDVGYARFYPPAPSDGTIAQWVEDAVARRDTLDPATGSTTGLMVRSRSCE
ncbi:TIR domain-containing protein [Demequina capsici]|uniref:TIR domain-containing protein n=1 Tax=Demequina capsici TaxID=3075620 RepID=A0AA96FD72_9MICO|nr:TIR domain-containing protein [Demequina sp. PMTSA13]WNM28149.1 TIR domain-containing protein [Demequina sp. PMTSA13]